MTYFQDVQTTAAAFLNISLGLKAETQSGTLEEHKENAMSAEERARFVEEIRTLKEELNSLRPTPIH